MSLYLVTGGAGFIGSHLTTALVERGERVRVLDDLSGGDRANLSHLDVGEPGSGAPVELQVASVTDADAVRAACRDVHGVFHEAAFVSVPLSVERPRESFATNVTGTLHVLEAAREAGVRSVVLASSSAVYGDDPTDRKVETTPTRPLSPYAGDKLAGETLLGVWGRSFGLRTVALRYFNVFGPRQSDDSPYSGVIALFARRLIAGDPITIYGDGEQTRDFVYVEDVVRANLLAAEAELEPGEVLNVASGESVSINALYGELAELVGRLGGAAPAEAPRRVAARSGDVRHSAAGIERIRERLGWEPRVARRAGLERTLEWYLGR